MKLPKQFAAARRAEFATVQAQWEAQPLASLNEPEIIERIKAVMSLLEEATYYNILAPLSLALRQAVFGVDLALLDNGKSPEVMALVELREMAEGVRSLIPELDLADSTYNHTSPGRGASLFAALSEHPDGHPVFEQLDQFLNKYGYLSAVATDIAVPTWRESPQPVKELLTQFLLQPPATPTAKTGNTPGRNPQKAQPGFPLAKLRQHQVQARLDLKGQVAEVYNRLLATLRSCFVELENRWLTQGHLLEQGDIFFLSWQVIQDQVAQMSANSIDAADSAGLAIAPTPLKLQVELEKGHWKAAGNHRAPYLVYGQPTAVPIAYSTRSASATLQGIGASAGQIEGTIHVLADLSDTSITINAQTILVVPYTDAGWSPLLARIGGLISEVGGQLSHGAIIAREYGIPAVMDVTDATHRLSTGQRVRLDGQQGTIEVIDPL